MIDDLNQNIENEDGINKNVITNRYRCTFCKHEEDISSFGASNGNAGNTFLKDTNILPAVTCPECGNEMLPISDFIN